EIGIEGQIEKSYFAILQLLQHKMAASHKQSILQLDHLALLVLFLNKDLYL
ncbi:9042_t:CDS:1, partial [Cetraspora pellucida]